MVATRPIEEILDRIETGRPEWMAEGLAALRAKGSDAVGPLMDALKSPAPLRRWAAASVLGELGDRAALPALRDTLADEQISVRLRAAYGLANLGVQDGISTLIQAVTSEEVMVGHPPELAGDFANQALESLSGRSFGLDASATPATRRQVAEHWEAWWREQSGSPGGESSAP